MMKKLLCTLILTVISVGFVNAQTVLIQGLGNNIPGDGSNTPDILDDTAFGNASTDGSSPVTHTFTIVNNTVSDLLSIGLNNLSNSVDFSQSTPPNPVDINAGEFSEFTVTFDPSVAGPLTSIVTVTVFNNDTFSDEVFTFNIGGTGELAAPEPIIRVFGGVSLNVEIFDGDAAIPSTGADFGSVTVLNSDTNTFRILNDGDANLVIDNFATPGSTDFSSPIEPFGADVTILPGDFYDFDVTYTPSGEFPASATIFIAHNDDTPASIEPFSFGVIGNGVNPLPEIDVQGLGFSIVDGDPSPIPGDDTDFGSTDVNTGMVMHTFTILNTGDADLLLNGAPIVEISGSSDFIVSEQPASTTIGGPTGSTTFEITFNPSTFDANPIQATVTIVNNDSDEGIYTFTIQGNGEENLPEIDLLDNVGAALAVGGNVSYPDTDVSSGTVIYTFTIQNNGSEVLNLTDPTPFVTIGGTNPGDFTLTALPGSAIAISDFTTFQITFNPSALSSRTATVSIANDDTTGGENPYTFTLQGNGIDANSGSPLMITQYYEGDDLANLNSWIEVKNVSATAYDTATTSYFLALYKGLAGTNIGQIQTSAPSESVLIPSLAPGAVVLFTRSGSTAPTNLGSAPVVPDEVCDFTGDDIILISTSEDNFCYDGRIDIIGEIGDTVEINWGQDTSLIKGCGTTEAPSITYTSDYLILTLDQVNSADVSSNLALGTQSVGSTIWETGTGWSNGDPDITKETVINGSYTETDGSFDACNLTVNPSGNIDIDGAGSNYVLVSGNLNINGGFTVGDTESLLTTDPNATINGSIIKKELSTTLNNYKDFTYWSSPVSTTIEQAFGGVDPVNPNRIFRWDQDPSQWFVASGTMTGGRGYIAEAPTDATQHLVNFEGTPNNGTVPVFLGYTNDGIENTDYNLIGNPYPSAIDIREFINLDNSDGGNVILDNGFLGGTIYLWTHNTQISGGTEGDFVKDDYASVNLTGGIQANSGGTIPTFFIGSGQGFFVRTTDVASPGTTIRPVFFTNSMRLDDNGDPHSNSQFFKSTTKKVEEERERLWLNVTSDGGAFSQILIGFFENATDGEDRGYDGSRFSAGNPIKLYSKIGDEKFAIQGLGTFNQSKEVALGFDTRIARTFKVEISNIEGVLKDEDVYLLDNTLNIVHDLKQSAYEFEITETGDYSDRFTLKFNNSVLDIEDLEFSKDFLVINEDNTLRIKANQEVSKLKVFDLLGRLLIDQKPNESDFYLNTKNIKKGTILILNATMQDGSIVSKKGIKY